MDDQRDYAEENYWRYYCPECDGRCTSTNGHAELNVDYGTCDECGGLCDEHGYTRTRIWQH
jgi:hypothetical protein